MCIFHKWTKWEQYTIECISFGFFWQKDHPGHRITERRQKRHCEKCGKEQDELVMPS
jgi:hypothetical protein